MAGPPPREQALDPEEVGRLVAGVHRVPFAGTRPPSTWSTDLVGADRWRGLVAATRDAGAPFADHLADYVDELVALELLDPLPADRTCHRDLWADNVRGCAAVAVCLRLGRGPGQPERGAGAGAVRVRPGDPARHRPSATPTATRADRASHSRRAFSMLIAQAGHIGEYQDHAVARGPARVR